MTGKITVKADESAEPVNPFEMLDALQLRIVKSVVDDGKGTAEKEFGLEAVESCLQNEFALTVIAHKERNKALVALISKDDVVASMFLSTQRIFSGDETNSTAKGHIVGGLQKLGNALHMFELQTDPEEPIELEWLS